jgi:mono/diheme cytochrome c family protein
MTSSRRARISSTLSASGLVLFAATCRHEPPRFEGLDPRQMPEEVRADYALFAQRCSKCHSLARPLQSGITGDEYWADYVERMRRQPGSGISREDAALILRFLHYLWTGQVMRGDQRPEAAAPARDGGDE